MDVSKVDTTVEIYGGCVEFPICVAPTALQRMAHKDGEVATAKGKLKLLPYLGQHLSIMRPALECNFVHSQCGILTTFLEPQNYYEV